jgi:hypothetical protein
VGAGGVFLLLSVLMVWAQLTFFDSEGFSSRATEALQESAVQSRLTEGFTARLIAARPVLEPSRPILEGIINSGISGLARSDQLRDVVRALHERLFDESSSLLLISLEAALGDARETLQRFDPGLAEDLPEIELTIIKASDARVRLLRLAHDVEALTYVLPALAVLCFAGPVYVAENRVGVVQAAAQTVQVVALMLLVSTFAGELLTGALASDEDAAAVRAVWTAFVGPLRLGLFAALIVGITVSIAYQVVTKLPKVPSRIDEA